MKQQIKLSPLILVCTIVHVIGMNPTLNEPRNIRDIPEYCATLTQILQNQITCYDNRNPDFYDHRILHLKNWEDCQIIAILSENIDSLFKNGKKQYPLSVTSFDYNPRYTYKNMHKSHSHTAIYGIKSPSDNRNFITRRSCYRVIDKLQAGWVTEQADTYYSHLHKDYPADDPHENDIDNWFFFSKRTNFLRNEASLIRFLVSRFGITNAITSRSTRTNDAKRTAAIHIWVLKNAFQQFQDLFDFEIAKPQDLRLNFDSSM